MCAPLLVHLIPPSPQQSLCLLISSFFSIKLYHYISKFLKYVVWFYLLLRFIYICGISLRTYFISAKWCSYIISPSPSFYSIPRCILSVASMHLGCFWPVARIVLRTFSYRFDGAHLCGVCLEVELLGYKKCTC